MKQILFLLILCCFFPGSSGAATFAPPEGQTLLFIGHDKKNIHNYVKSVGVVPAGVMVYTSLSGLEGLARSSNYGSGEQHAQWLVENYSESSLQIGLYLVGALDRVNLGIYDKKIKKFARWVKRINRPVYLRIGYEFDNPQNNYDPQQYKRAFARIVKIMRRERVENVAYVWHAHAGPGRDYISWYPGDRFVDWIAVSYFSPYNTENMGDVLAIARKHNKPFMLAESSAIKTDFSKGKDAFKLWFRLVQDYIIENKIEAFCYVNVNWDEQAMFKELDWGDARIQTNAVLLENWLDMIRQKPFMNASEEHFSTIGFKMNKSNIRNRYY